MRASLRAELLGQLGVVMTLAAVVLVATLVWSHDRALQHVLGRALLAEARDHDGASRVHPATSWWTVTRDGHAQSRGAVSAPIDARTLALAETARREAAAVVDAGAPWSPIRFAVATGPRGEVLVARLPAEVSLQLRAKPLAVVAGLVLATVGLFLAVGLVLLRTRIVEPLEGVARAARALTDEGGDVRVPVDGPREAAELATAFNEMSEALAARNKSLSDAVAGLRASNRELRRTQAGLDRSERLAAVGRLAAGVAHEVGNPLGAMLAFVEVAARDAGISDTSRRHLAKASDAGERVRRILGRLLDFSSPAAATSAPFDAAAVVRDCLELVSAQRSFAHVRVEVSTDPSTPLALGDASVAAQIVLNLLLNAAHACAGQEAPRIAVRIAPAVLQKSEGSEPAETAKRAYGDAVACVVADNGSGIAPEDRARIFDLFFTTKAPGEGTGLGLPTALRQAQEMCGDLELCAIAPAGFSTAFELRIPAATAAQGVRVTERTRSVQVASQSAGDCAADGPHGAAAPQVDEFERR
jgi:signal transduction histidine kinase